MLHQLEAVPDTALPTLLHSRLALTFCAGMQCVLDKSTSPVNALSFGRLESTLLAFGMSQSRQFLLQVADYSRRASAVVIDFDRPNIIYCNLQERMMVV